MNQTNSLPPVAQALEALGVSYQLFDHGGPVRSLEQAAQERGQQLQQVVRTILFRLSNDDFVLVLMPGGLRVDWPTLRRYLRVSRVTMATPEEVLKVTGYPIGAVGPLGLPRPLRILADRRVFAPTEISFGSGVPGVAVILASADLRRILPKAEIGDFGKEGKSK